MRPTDRTIVLLLGVLVAVVIGWLLKVGAPILQPLVIALLLAGMLQPVLRALMRVGIPPVLSALLILAVLAYGLIQGAFVLESNLRAFIGGHARLARAVEPAGPGDVPRAADDAPGPTAPAEASEPPGSADPGAGGDPAEATEEPAPGPASEGAPDGDRDAGRDLDPFSPSNTELSESFGGWMSIVATVEQRLGELSLPDELVGYVVRELQELNRNKEALTLGLLGSGVEVLRSVLLVLLYMLFIFAEQAIFRRKILAIAGDRREQAQEMLDTIGRGIQRFLGLKTLVSFATGALCYAALVALEIPYALLFGFLTFAFNFIPYFGSIVAGVLPTVTAFAIGATWNTVIIIVVVYIAVNFLIGNIMEPRVMGRELDLSPLVILVSVVVWGSLWGLVGAFLAVPLTATLQIILASSDATRPVALMLSSGPPRGSGRGLRPG